MAKTRAVIRRRGPKVGFKWICADVEHDNETGDADERITSFLKAHPNLTLADMKFVSDLRHGDLRGIWIFYDKAKAGEK